MTHCSEGYHVVIILPSEPKVNLKPYMIFLPHLFLSLFWYSFKSFSVHYRFKRLCSAVSSSTELRGLPTLNGQKLVSIPVKDQARFYKNKFSGGALIFRDKKQIMCTEGANPWRFHPTSALSVSLFHSFWETSISILTLQTDTRSLSKELSLNRKLQKKTERTEERSPTRLSFINDKPEDESCQSTQPYKHFVSFFKEEEISVLN